jgi:hypothetical protein
MQLKQNLGYGAVDGRGGFSYVAVLLFVAVLSVLGLSFISRTGIGTALTLKRGTEIEAEYLAEAAANHAMWRLLNDATFPPAEDRYYMHSLGAGRYGYAVRRHTNSTFATVGTIGAVGESVVNRSYVLRIEPPVATGSMITGTYLGDGQDDRAITGVGFQPDVVIIKSERDDRAVIRTSSMAGDLSKRMQGNVAAQANLIQSLDADGFTIGANDHVNRNNADFYWAAFRGLPGEMELGTYVGDGTNGRPITGLSFAPAMVIVFSEAAYQVLHKSVNAAASYDFGGANPVNNAIRDPLLADGFEVGNDDRVNRNGEIYHYIAWQEIAGQQAFGTYTGNWTDGRYVQGLGFEPEYVIVRCVSEGRKAVHRTESLAGDATLFFMARTNATDRIQALLPDGFEVGRNRDVNRNNRTYVYYAWKEM